MEKQGEVFKLKLGREHFLHEGFVYYTDNTNPPMMAKVKKVYKFNWWRKLLFKMGFSIKSMEIENPELIIKDKWANEIPLERVNPRSSYGTIFDVPE